MQLEVNITGNFGSGMLHKDQLVDIPDDGTIKMLLKELRHIFNTKFFSISNLNSNLYLIMVNGEKIEPKKAKRYRLQKSDKISILQPLQGGS